MRIDLAEPELGLGLEVGAGGEQEWGAYKGQVWGVWGDEMECLVVVGMELRVVGHEGKVDPVWEKEGEVLQREAGIAPLGPG